MGLGIRRLATGAALALVTGASVMVGTAGAAIGCGSTITTDTTLTADITGCTNNGLLIGADNITVNLNGHTISGTPNVAGDGAGVLIAGRTGVTVRGGTITDFDGGVVIAGGSKNTVSQIVARNNIGDVSEALFTDFGDGILVFASNNNTLTSNLVDHNGPFDGIGLLGNSDGNQLIGNVVQNNNLPDARPGHEDPSGNEQEDDGIRFETIDSAHSPDFNVARGNTVNANGLDGFAVFPFAHDNTIDSNALTGNGVLGNIRPGDGIHIFGRSQRTLVTNNRATGNARDGVNIDATGPSDATQPVANRVIGNIVVQNGAAPHGFPSFDLVDSNPSCLSDVWQQNQFHTSSNPGTPCIH